MIFNEGDKGGQEGDMSPCVPQQIGGWIGGQRGHFPLGMSPCPPPPMTTLRGESMPLSRRSRRFFPGWACRGDAEPRLITATRKIWNRESDFTLVPDVPERGPCLETD